MTTDSDANYRSAAQCFADLVDDIGSDAWDGPGLGVWNLRSLVGHTTRAFTTVTTYLHQPVAEEQITSAAQYYELARTYASQAGAKAIAERGRIAGETLGEDPALTVRTLMDDAFAALDHVSGDPVIDTIVGGMRFSAYLPTRTFELAVHIGDIAAATGLPVDVPAEVLTDAITVASAVTVRLGEGPALLRSLTGRGSLPDGFSVV